MVGSRIADPPIPCPHWQPRETTSVNMKQAKSLGSRLIAEQEGQDLIEYSLLAALISVIAVLAIGALGSKVNTNYQNIQTSIP
jgi:Flp pilus assembly pilin Flp